MILKEFIKKFVEPNTLIRLVYKQESGHRTVLNSWDDVSMEWEILKERGIYTDYVNREVIGITDILVNGHYKEAINISIKDDNI